MKLLCALSKDNLELAKAEVLALTDVKDYELIDNFLIIGLERRSIPNLARRLAYTKEIHELLFITNKKELLKKIKEYNWNSIYKKDFKVRAHSLEEKNIADLIWDKLTKPKANLKYPTTQFNFIKTKKSIIATLLTITLKHEFDKRKSHVRPEKSPTALDPKLARAIINLTGIRSGKVFDPFCGAGGILIEAGLMGLEPVGYDLYDLMLKKARKNLDHFKVKNYKLKQEDATKIKENFDYIATDVPYGLNTSIWKKTDSKLEKISLNKGTRSKAIKELEGFYLEFLNNLRKVCQKRAVIIFPNYVNYKKLVKESKFQIKNEFKQYIHGSLTRIILVLE